MQSFKSIRFAIATSKGHFIVLSCLFNPSNPLSGNNLSLSSASTKDVPCSISLTVLSISLDVISISSIASAFVVDEDFIAFDLLFKLSSNFLNLTTAGSLYLLGSMSL